MLQICLACLLESSQWQRTQDLVDFGNAALINLVCAVVQIAASGKRVHVVAPDYGEYARSFKM
jgi:hypothetical protein